MSTMVQKDFALTSSLAYRCNLGLLLGMLAALNACGTGVAVDAAGNATASANAAQPSGNSGQVVVAAQPTLIQKMPDSAGTRGCLHCAP